MLLRAKAGFILGSDAFCLFNGRVGECQFVLHPRVS